MSYRVHRSSLPQQDFPSDAHFSLFKGFFYSARIPFFLDEVRAPELQGKMYAEPEEALGFGWCCVRDESGTTKATTSSTEVVLRSDIGSADSASEWVKHYGAATHTAWIVYNCQKEKCQRMVCHKVLRCHLSQLNKVCDRRTQSARP